MSLFNWRDRKASTPETVEATKEPQTDITGVPEVKIPEDCKGDAQIIVEEGALEDYEHGQVAVYFSCPAQNDGRLIRIYETERSMHRVTKQQLDQIAAAGAISVKSICWNCPLGLNMQAPDDLSQLDR